MSHWFGWWVQSYTCHLALSSTIWPFGPAQSLRWSWREQKMKWFEAKWDRSLWSFCSSVFLTLPLNKAQIHPNYPPWHQFVIKKKIFQHSAHVLKKSIPFFHFIWWLLKTFALYCSIFPFSCIHTAWTLPFFSFLKLWISGLWWWKMNCWPPCYYCSLWKNVLLWDQESIKLSIEEERGSKVEKEADQVKKKWQNECQMKKMRQYEKDYSFPTGTSLRVE